MKHGKRYRSSLQKIDRQREYSLTEAVSMIRSSANAKFDETIEVSVNLGVDPRHADQNIRVTLSLPYGTGKVIKVLVLTEGPSAKEGEEAGADYVGSDDFIQKLEKGWDEVDVIVATPNMMPKLGRLGKILGPRGLMPNPKSGTVTKDVGKAVKEIKAGRIELRVDRYGIIHAPVGKKSFDSNHLSENIKSVVSTLQGVKPSAVKGTYFQKIILSSTMGPGVKIDKATLI